MHLATRLGTGATRVAPQDEKTEETEEGEAQWPTSGSAGSWWSVGESWSHWQYNWQSNWGGGSASGESWTALHSSSSSSRSHSKGKGKGKGKGQKEEVAEVGKQGSTFADDGPQTALERAALNAAAAIFQVRYARSARLSLSSSGPELAL